MDEPTIASNSSGSTGLSRVRIGVLFIAYTISGTAAGAIFDSLEWSLLIAPLAPTIAALVLATRAFPLRLLSAGASIVASVAIAVWLTNGSASDVVDAFTAGPQRLLSTDWPSPARPDLIGTVAATLAIATALSAELATRRRWHLLPLLPLFVTYVAIVAMSAPAGVNLVWPLALAATSAIFATLRNEGSLGERLMLLGGERRLLPLLVIAGLIAGLVSVPVAMASRADPRRNDPAQLSAPLLDPIEATLALRDLDPPIELHTLEGSQDDALPTRWRTAALESYDGQRWSPTLTLRPIGRTLGVATNESIEVDIRFLNADLQLVPFPGAPIAVDALIETDQDRTVVRLIERPGAADVIAVTANLAPSSADDKDRIVAAREIDEDVSGLTDLATTLSGEGTLLEQLTQLEQTMRNEFILDSGAPGGGLQRALIERFLRDTRRGNAEQFATGFVLLARSLGAQARVATGFIAADDAVEGTLQLSSEDAAIWPEVLMVNEGWLAFNPVPDVEASGATPPPPDPQVQAPAAPQPPIAPPPDATENNETINESDESDSTSAFSNVATVLVRGAAVAGILLLPIVALAAIILGAKFRRQRRRRRATDPTDRIRGSWATATDALVDAGLFIGHATTDSQIASDGEGFVDSAHREMHRLAKLSSAATFGAPERPDLLVEDAATCLDVLNHSMATERTLWQRLRWRLSLRSLRSGTRSPVAT